MNVNLVLLKRNGTRKSFPLPSTVTVIGRRQDCDLCIPLMLVSRKHCEINQDQHVLKLRDLGSRNGTYINGKRVDEVDIKPGDYIQIGPVTFGLQIDGQPENITPPKSAEIQQPASIAPSDGAPGTNTRADRSGTFAGLQELDPSGGNNATELLNWLNAEEKKPAQ